MEKGNKLRALGYSNAKWQIFGKSRPQLIPALLEVHGKLMMLCSHWRERIMLGGFWRDLEWEWMGVGGLWCANIPTKNTLQPSPNGPMIYHQHSIFDGYYRASLEKKWCVLGPYVACGPVRFFSFFLIFYSFFSFLKATGRTFNTVKCM